jgi:ribosome-associated translation inhibitor RaiA
MKQLSTCKHNVVGSRILRLIRINRAGLISLKTHVTRHGRMWNHHSEARMETAAQIELEGVQPSAEFQGTIERHLAELEMRFGRVTAARVVVRGPGEHHQSGGQYQVSIRLALPDGREVNIGRTPSEDARYADLTFAVDNAFKRARRQLQDQARVMRGDIKHRARSRAGGS